MNKKLLIPVFSALIFTACGGDNQIDSDGPKEGVIRESKYSDSTRYDNPRSDNDSLPHDPTVPAHDYDDTITTHPPKKKDKD